MSQDVALVRLSTSESPGPPYRRSAFAVFAFALAMGTLIHEWNSTWDILVALPAVVAAIAVLLKPDSPVRLMVLMGTLVAECVRQLPEPVNHQMLLGILGVALGVWWLALLVRSPEVAHDPALLYDRIAPFLRVSFILMWAIAALAKFNSGFFDTAATCAVWILESIPLVVVPAMFVPVVIAATLLMELALPVLLFFHRTRPYAIMVALPFHALSSLAGHSWFSGFAWAFYALFLPPVVLARGMFVARTLLPEWLRRGWDAARAHPVRTMVIGAVLYYVGHRIMIPALGGMSGGARHWSAVLLCLGWMGFTVVVLWRLRRSWFPGVARPKASLAVRNGVLIVGLVALVLNGASPYLGLKTTSSFTMFSNLRTEPGHWNSALVPESARVFGWQDGGDVRFLATGDPDLADHLDGDEGYQHTVLLGARHIAQEHPDASVEYMLDGEQRVASPISADPVLGAPLTWWESWFGGTRPYTVGGTCQH